MDCEQYTGFLHFGHLSFKVSVLQELIYVKKIYSWDYEMESFFQTRDTYATRENWIYEATKRIDAVKIPSYLSEYITELCIHPDNTIYCMLIPEKNRRDSYFQIQEISDEELRQFPKLKLISMNGMQKEEKLLEAQLKNRGIKLTVKGKHTVYPLLALLILLAISVGTGVGASACIKKKDLVQMTVSEEKMGSEDTADSGAVDTIDKEQDQETDEADIEEEPFIELTKYQYVESVDIIENGETLETGGFLVSNDNENWELIMNDYTTPRRVDMKGSSQTWLGSVDISSETPVFIPFLDKVQERINEME